MSADFLVVNDFRRTRVLEPLYHKFTSVSKRREYTCRYTSIILREKREFCRRQISVVSAESVQLVFF